MQLRTSIILGCVALGLFLFIVFFERGTVTTTERDQRKGRVLDTFVRERVTRIEVQRKGVTLALTRGPDKESGLDLGAWQVVAPYTSKAESESVDALIGELEWIDPKRTLEGLKPEDVVRFGLDKPRYRVSFVQGSVHVAFSIGSATPQNDGSYLRVGADPRAYVVGKTLLEALDHDAADYHTKELHNGVTIYSTRTLALRNAHGSLAVEKRDETFWLTKPEATLASQPALAELVNALDGLKATRYISNDRSQLASFGLAPATLQLDLATHSYDDKAKGKFVDGTLQLSVGAACKGHDAESYVRIGDGPVMCASDSELKKLDKSAADLRERRALPLEDLDIHGARVRSGTQELVLAQQGDDWSYQLLDRGRPKLSGAADPAAVADWFKALRASTAARFESAGAPTLDAELGNPNVTASFERAKGKPSYVLKLGRSDAELIAAARSDDNTLAWFPLSLVELLSTQTARFHKLRLLDEKPADATTLVLTRAGAVSESVAAQTPGCELAGPVHAACERSTVDEIIRLMSALEAPRFVADAPQPEHGLSQPAWVLRMTYVSQNQGAPTATAAAPRVHSLRVGAPSGDGRFAQLDADPAVFVVPKVLVDQLEEPLVNRAALATPLESLQSLTVERPGAKLQLEAGEAGSSLHIVGAANDDARAQRMARALATLRASALTEYGHAPAEQGLDHPHARVEVHERGSAAGHTLLIGNPTTPPQVAGHFVRRSDWDVSFVIPADAVQALLDEPAPAAAPQP